MHAITKAFVNDGVDDIRVEGSELFADSFVLVLRATDIVAIPKVSVVVSPGSVKLKASFNPQLTDLRVCDVPEPTILAVACPWSWYGVQRKQHIAERAGGEIRYDCIDA